MAVPGQNHDWQAAFLEALRNTGVVSHACRIADVHKSTVYERAKSDDAFRTAMEAADQQGKDALILEARRRALEGVEKPLLYQGRIVAHVREYSDHLLDRLLRGYFPHIFKDSLRVEASGPDGGPIRHELSERLSSMSDHERAALRRVIDEALAKAGDAAPADPATEAPA